MRLNDYQWDAKKTDKGGGNHGSLCVHLLGLVAEVGELSGKVNKSWRDGTNLDEHALMMEAGDIFWQLSAVIGDLGYSLEEVAEANLAKLRDRAERGVIGGSGDER